METEKISVILPSSMFIKSTEENFVAYIVKNKNIHNYIFYVDPINKKIDTVLLTDEIIGKCSCLEFVNIDRTPYNIFYLEGDLEWSIFIDKYKNSKPLVQKGFCYITGNIYKDQNGWGVLPVKFSIKDIEKWIQF